MNTTKNAPTPTSTPNPNAPFASALEQNLQTLKKLLPSEDILTYSFETADKRPCAIIYADGMVNKELLARLVASPLSATALTKLLPKNDVGRVATNDKKPQPNEQEDTQANKQTAEKTAEQTAEQTAEIIESAVERSQLFPEFKSVETLKDGMNEILDGNTLLLIDQIPTGFIAGAKLLPVRTVAEPPTDVAVKGPREGFIEDIKTNMALVRKRLKTPSLRFETLRVGEQSYTAVTLCYLEGTSTESVKDELKKKLQSIKVDNIPDSSYISAFLAPRKHSIFRTVGTTEKPDIFTAKISEGRVGILVDGSPIALTVPYITTEDLQSSEDYFISPFTATVFRFLRLISLFVAILLPAFYVSAQLFKMQLLPLGLMLTIASSVRELPLSPSMEMFVVLLLLEILKEASIRMPKYVGMSLSVVGALVLGETAVSAGFLSTPAIIIVAFSGICLYTVPNFVETGSLLRWLFLLVGGGLGPFGIVLLGAFTLCVLVTADAYGTPPLAPFSPLIKSDLRDAVVKYDLQSLTARPAFLRSKNKTRLKVGSHAKKAETDDETDDEKGKTNADGKTNNTTGE